MADASFAEEKVKELGEEIAISLNATVNLFKKQFEVALTYAADSRFRSPVMDLEQERKCQEQMSKLAKLLLFSYDFRRRKASNFPVVPPLVQKMMTDRKAELDGYSRTDGEESGKAGFDLSLSPPLQSAAPSRDPEVEAPDVGTAVPAIVNLVATPIVAPQVLLSAEEETPEPVVETSMSALTQEMSSVQEVLVTPTVVVPALAVVEVIPEPAVDLFPSAPEYELAEVQEPVVTPTVEVTPEPTVEASSPAPTPQTNQIQEPSETPAVETPEPTTVASPAPPVEPPPPPPEPAPVVTPPTQMQGKWW